MSDVLTPDALEAAALAMVEARRTARPIDVVPPEWVPQTLAEAYRLQDAVMRHEGVAGGWKVLADGSDAPICSPIPKSRYFEDGATLDRAGLMIFLTEVEVAVRLGQTLAPKGAPYTAAEAAAAIASVHPALEMCATSFAADLNAPHLLKMGDLQSNAAVIVGAALPGGADIDFADLAIDLRYDGSSVEQTSQGAPWEQITQALAWLANHAIGRGQTLNAGDVIITGARIKHPAAGPLAIEARVAGMTPVRLALR